MGNKSSIHPPPSHRTIISEGGLPARRVCLDESEWRQPNPIPAALRPSWAGSRMSLSGSRVDLSYAIDTPQQSVIMIPPDPRMLRKIHKEQKKMLKRMKGLPVEVIVAPRGATQGLPSTQRHPSFSIDNLYPRSLDGCREGSSIDSPFPSSVGSRTLDAWCNHQPGLQRSYSRPRSTIETEYHSTQREHHESYPPPAPVARTRSLWQAVNHPPAAGYYHGPIPLRSPRTQRVPRPLRSPRSPRVLTKQAASNWSSSSPGSDRQSASTGDIDFSWVREEEGRLRRKDKASLPECYFGMEDETHAVGHKQGFIVRPKMRQACKNSFQSIDESQMMPLKKRTISRNLLKKSGDSGNGSSRSGITTKSMAF